MFVKKENTYWNLNLAQSLSLAEEADGETAKILASYPQTVVCIYRGSLDGAGARLIYILDQLNKEVAQK